MIVWLFILKKRYLKILIMRTSYNVSIHEVSYGIIVNYKKNRILWSNFLKYM